MFNEHGGFELKLDGNILLAVVNGAWNAETAQAYREAILKLIESLHHKPWALISNVNDWELCTPDCELLMGQLLAECRGKGIKREAVINSNIQSVKLDLFHKHTKQQSLKPPPDVFQRCFFETEEEARKWLKNEGYG